MATMIRASDHPEDAFAEAYDRYADALFRHCYLRLGNRERAKDIVQDTFMKTWEYVAAGRDIIEVQAFLYRTAGNLVIDEVRRRKRRREESLEELQEAGFDTGDDAPAQRMADRLDERRVMEILAQLDDGDRDLVVLRYVEGRKPAEIAELLDLSANVVSVRLHRALGRLKTLLSIA